MVPHFRLQTVRSFLGGLALSVLLSVVAPGLAGASPILVNRIAARVGDDVILKSEVEARTQLVLHSFEQSGVLHLGPTNRMLLGQRVLERMILEKVQLQMAEEAGITVDELTQRQAAQQIARRNSLTDDQLRGSLRESGVVYSDFLGQLRDEIMIGRLQGVILNSSITVTDAEVDRAVQAAQTEVSQHEYLLGRILITVPYQATSESVKRAKTKALSLMSDLSRPEDFEVLQLQVSDAPDVLGTKNLGWRRLEQLPLGLQGIIPTSKVGGLVGPIQTLAGFSFYQLQGVRESQRNADVVTPKGLEELKAQVRDAIYKRKLEEATEVWLFQVRSEADVEIYRE